MLLEQHVIDADLARAIADGVAKVIVAATSRGSRGPMFFFLATRTGNFGDASPGQPWRPPTRIHLDGAGRTCRQLRINAGA